MITTDLSQTTGISIPLFSEKHILKTVKTKQKPTLKTTKIHIHKNSN